MIQSLLQYLGLDRETKSLRKQALNNLKRASDTLEQIQLQLASRHSKDSIVHLRKVVEIDEKRRIGT